MSTWTRLKRLIVGKPIATKHAQHERLPVWTGLPVFASDALSSVAYATEEILLVLMLSGSMYLSLVWNVSWWLALLMIIVAFSYFQTIHAYPKGGGTYLVSTENLGSFAGRVAGASLLIDYVLTVAVSISSGVAALVALAPGVKPFAVHIAVIAILLVMVANLRGAKESGAAFALPTYTFCFLVFSLIITGLIAMLRGEPHTAPPSVPMPSDGWHAMGALVMMRAFAASCTALTGTEAIADGVQAFKPPEVKNASLTLSLMVVMLLAMFLGISFLVVHAGIAPDPERIKTVLAQIADHYWGHDWRLWLLQLSTAGILFLAANTAYADFPRLSSFIARDGFLPRQLALQGDRLVFQNGIVLLSLTAIALVVIFHADTHSLIPLYAMGVFISFTLSQAGMAVKLKREKAPFYKFCISAFGSLVTLVVLGIIAVTKFTDGAWMIFIALGIMLLVFYGIRRHYNYLADQLTLRPEDDLKNIKTTALLLVPKLHRGILHAVSYAQAMSKDVRALHVTMDPESAKQVKQDWIKYKIDIPLVILESPYRSLVEPVTEYIDQTIEEDPNLMVTVIVPQAVPKRWYQAALHNNVAVPLKLALQSRKNVVVTNVRYFLK
jgi:amino acid transporter